MAQKQRVGIRGRSSSSKTLGTSDPRLSRNARVHTRGEDDAPPLIRDDFGRRALDLGTSLEVVDGKLGVFSRLAIKRVTANLYYALVSDEVLLVDTTINVVSVLLPKASTVVGKVYYIKKINAGALGVSIDPFGTEKVDGQIAPGHLSFSTAYDAYMIVSDGTQWWII